MKRDDELIKDVHVLLHPLRYRIVELLEEKPMHINEISNALEEETRLVSYHLLILVEHGFLRSNYEISERSKSRRKVTRKYRVTEKVEEVIDSFVETSRRRQRQTRNF